MPRSTTRSMRKIPLKTQVSNHALGTTVRSSIFLNSHLRTSATILVPYWKVCAKDVKVVDPRRIRGRQHIECAKFPIRHELGTIFYVLKQYENFTNEYHRTQNDDYRTKLHKILFLTCD